MIGGSTAVKMINGSSAEKMIDGSSVEKMIDGSSMVKMIDGSSVEKMIDGSSVEKMIDGSSVEKMIDGSTAVKKIDGSSPEKMINRSSVVKIIGGFCTDDSFCIDHSLSSALTQNSLSSSLSQHSLSSTSSTLPTSHMGWESPRDTTHYQSMDTLATHFASGGSIPVAPQPNWSPSQPYPLTDTTNYPPPPAPTTHSFRTTSPPPSDYWSSSTARHQQLDHSESRFSRSKTYERLRRKVNKRQNEAPICSTSPSLFVQSTPPVLPAKNHVTHNYNTSRERSWRSEGEYSDKYSEESSIGHEEDESETHLLLKILSNIHTPRVSEVLTRSALLVWSPPVREIEPELEFVSPISDSDLKYEVLLSDKGKAGKYRSIFSGASLSCQLTDLRPHTQYYIRVRAVLKSHNLRGGVSEAVSFLTKACEPDHPNPPKLIQRTTTTINLKWKPPVDNGSHILHYILEMADSTLFVPIYTGHAKAYNVTKLQSSTLYKFRLIAVNELGRSRPSEVVWFKTQGSPPSQPVPPHVNPSRMSGKVAAPITGAQVSQLPFISTSM